ncbi:HD domain-containing protein [Kitasatospora sp. NPDC096147]|uniref:HD domain-containing protein n=1 Tax=Kitasatospora sp. NPDC096147 TaxID=3364093 RepID=UPI00381A77E2
MTDHPEQSETVRPVRSGVLGLAAEFSDPLWRVPVRLAPVEVELLRSEPVRRLHFVAHAGASSLCTLQSYSRLEHSLGVLSLVAHFRPRDELLRVAALVHDIGHLPLSHTFEGVGGLEHHALGAELLRAEPLRGLLERHGIDPEAVVAVLDGEPVTPLTGRPGLMNLDHLDSFVRSGRAAGRFDADPAVLLARLRLAGEAGEAVSADRESAGVLVGLVAGEARLHTSWENVGPVSVVRRLAERLLDRTPLTPAGLARLTDAQFWTALDACPATGAEGRLVRYQAHRLAVRTGGAAGDEDEWGHALRKIYVSAPLVDGEPVGTAAPDLAAELARLRRLPTEFRIRWQDGPPPGDRARRPGAGG